MQILLVTYQTAPPPAEHTGEQSPDEVQQAATGVDGVDRHKHSTQCGLSVRDNKTLFSSSQQETIDRRAFISLSLQCEAFYLLYM